MRVDVEDWKNGWMGVDIGLSRAEIDALIARLQMLKAEPDQHFHISTDYKGAAGIGEITLYVKETDQVDNMWVGGKALAPGDEI